MAIVANSRPTALVAALTTVHVLATIALALVMASAPTLKSDFGLNQTEYGLLVSAFYVGQIALAIPSGQLVDRIGVRRGLALALLASAGCLFGLALASVGWIAALLMLVLGIAAALVNPGTAKGVFDWMPAAKRAPAMSIKQMGVPLGAMLGAGGAYLAAADGRPPVFAALAAALGAGTLVLLMLPRASPHGRESGGPGLLALLRNRQLLAVSVGNGLLNIGQVGLWASVASYGASLGGEPGIGAVFFAVLHAGSAAGRLALGWAAYRVGPHRLWLLIVVVGGIGSVALLALAAVTDVTGVLLLLVVLGLTIGSYPGVVQAMALITVPRQSAAAAIGINMTLVLTGAMLAPLVIGAVVDLGAGFRGAFVALAAAPALGCLLLAWTRDRGAHRSG